MIFCSLFAAALTACGGGSGGAAPSATAAVASDAPAVSVAADAPAMVAGGTDVPSPLITPVADTVGTPEDPDASTINALAVKTSVVTVPLAAEGQTFRVAGTMAVRFGAGNSWVTKNVTDSGTCSAAFFGAKTSTTVRSCQVQVAVTTNNGTPTGSIGLPSVENGSFFTFAKATVQYGANGKYVTKEVTGRGDCTNAFFGSDPISGYAKNCTVLPSGTGTLAAVSLLPKVDISKIPAAVAGFATPRVMAANLADAGQHPTPSDIGDFREYCEYSHMSYDDPIVAPGSVGGHLHTFLGNTGTDRNSTAESLAKTGNSTCAGGTLNRTAYWIPSVIDTTDGTPQKPTGALIYYKQGYNYIAAQAIKPYPAGLRIVAGNAASTTAQNGFTGFTCFRTDGTSTTHSSIPTDCPTGATLNVGIGFPQCWDGVNLDSPDHKSHMAYAHNGCPTTHPVPLTHITFNVGFKVGPNGTRKWRLSSDNYDSGLPGGYSVHADWYNAWNTETMNTWTTRCINAQVDCHAYLLGDGRILY